MSKDLICVGAIMGAFGVKGEVRLKSFCATPKDIDQYGILVDETGAREFDIKVTRSVKTGFSARIKDIKYKDQADGLKGVRLFVNRERLPDLPDDEYYHADLLGLKAFDPNDELIGTIKAVQNFGAGDILEVKLKNSNKVMQVPFTMINVPAVYLNQQKIIIDMIE